MGCFWKRLLRSWAHSPWVFGCWGLTCGIAGQRAAASQGGQGWASPLLLRGGAALASGGSGSVAGHRDLSTLDANPAYLSMGRQVDLMGNGTWQQGKFSHFEVGVIDSYLSDLSAGFKLRQRGGLRRWTLGLAQAIEGSGFVLGVAADYQGEQGSHSKRSWSDDIRDGKGLQFRWGLSGQVSEKIMLGVRSDGYGNKGVSIEHGLGVMYLVNASTGALVDLVFDKNFMKQYAIGALVSAQNYTDIGVSFTHNTRTEREHWAAGVVFKAPKLALGYWVSGNGAYTMGAQQPKGGAWHQLTLTLGMSDGGGR